MPECSLVPKSYSLFPYFLYIALLNSIPTYLLNFLNQTRAWFLKITSVWMCVCVVCVLCVCVSAPGAIKNYSREMTYQISPNAFQFLCTALAIDTVDGRGLSYEARCVLLPKKSKVTLYLPFITR